VTSTELLVKRSAGDTQRETFLRFNAAGLAHVRSAFLKLYLQGRDTTPAVQEVVVRAFSNLEWNEASAVWTNAPGGLRLPTIFLANDDPTIVARTNMPTSAGST
jgi:hypothetical protein